jgi:TRAP-type C4-dicarboxylate transport system permease small subunit
MFRDIMKRILQPILAALVVLIVLTTTSQVISRYVFGSPLIWTEEIARYFGIWLVLLGSGYVLGERMHVGIDFLVQKLPRKAGAVFEIISYICTIVVSAALLLYGVRLVMAVRNARTAALRISMGWVYLAVPIGAAILGLYAIQMIVLVARYGRSPEAGSGGDAL